MNFDNYHHTPSHTDKPFVEEMLVRIMRFKDVGVRFSEYEAARLLSMLMQYNENESRAINITSRSRS